MCIRAICQQTVMDRRFLTSRIMSREPREENSRYRQCECSMEIKIRWKQEEDIEEVGAGRIDLRNIRYFSHGDCLPFFLQSSLQKCNREKEN